MIVPVQRLAGWGGVPAEPCRMAQVADSRTAARLLAAGFPATGKGSGDRPAGQLIGRGLGRAYGDSALFADRLMPDCTVMDRFIARDPESGQLTCEAAVSFAEIIAVLLPRGWFLPTTPGTKFVTVGGAIAADVHGKNHDRVGSLGNFVDWIGLLLADGRVVRCSRTADPELFFATQGGMGLTGLILAAAFRLVKVKTASVRSHYQKTADLDATVAAFADGDAGSEHSVAWIDCMGGGGSLGRSVVMQGSPATRAEVGSRGDPLRLPVKRTKTMPFPPPLGLPSPLTVKVVDLASFFYPLDAVRHWIRLYGPRVWSCTSPFSPGNVGRRPARAARRRGAVGRGLVSGGAQELRGGRRRPALVSRARPHAHARNPVSSSERARPRHRLDPILLDYGGRLYLANDSLMSAETFRGMYPRLAEFLAVKRRVDPDGRFASAPASRVGLVS